MIRIFSILLITFFTTAYTPGPEPRNGSGGFISVFDNKLKRADRYFNNFEYKSAIKLYTKLVEKGKADEGVKLRLAESYVKINDPVNAEKWFSEVMHSDQITPQHQIQYAHTLLSNGKYEEARQVINTYEFAASDYRSKAIINTLDKLEIFYADSMFYQLSSIEDNKPHYSDFSPTIFKEGIVFVSSRHDKGPKFKWDDTPFLDLYYTESDVASARPFSKSLNTKYHEGPIAFYDNYTKAVFTRSNYLDKELGLTDQGINNLQLYTTSWDEDKNDWDNIKPINFIINNYSYGHPTISTDNTMLYFISDMPGGFGGTDLYLSERNESGWGEPVNMGEVINTSGNEMYPFIDDENNLYFASNGHGGLGGLDVYQIQLDGPMDIRNMGYPLNTTADDFGFTLSPSGQTAYISSNREGPDNIFQIDIKADLEMILANNSINTEVPEIDNQIELLAASELSTQADSDELEGFEDLSTINASIIDENNEVLENANLKLLINGVEKENLISNNDGKVTIQVPAGQEYTLIASKEGFKDRVIAIPAESLGQEEDLLIVMNSIFVDSDIPEDQIPTTELDPLAISADPWEDSVLEQNDRPEINGVALAAVPALSETNEDDLSTTELDPLAVSGDGWDKNILDNNERPDIEGVALTELPDDSSQDSDKWSTTELDPLAVNSDSWDNRALDNNERPDIAGVALADLPNDSGQSSDEIFNTELNSFDESNNEKQLVEAFAVDTNSNELLANADIKLFVDGPNEALEYELKDGVLTFEALPDEDYIIVATHEDYQDEFIKISGDDLLAEEDLTFELVRNDELQSSIEERGPSTKFKAQVLDEETNERLNDAEVRFFVDGKAIESEITKDNGKTVFKSPPGEDFMMLVSRKGYQDLIYHLPGVPEENMDVELAMLKAEDIGPYSPYQLLAIKGHAYDEFSGVDLSNVTFKVFENGDLVETTNDLSSIEVDPQKQYKVLASKEGYQETMTTIDPSALNKDIPVDLIFAMKQEQISEVTGAPIYNAIVGETIPITATVIDIRDNQPISEAVVIVFANDIIQGKTTTWNSGTALINVVPGKDYQLIVKRDGYSDRIVNLGVIRGSLNDDLQIAMIPQDIQNLRQSGLDLSEANMLVMTGPSGEEQLYLSTDNDLFQYTIENGNHYLVNDSQTILLKERSRSINSKVTTKQDTDHFNMRSEDQFLYDQLTADEKETVDQIVDHLQQGSNLEEYPELNIYYNNLPAEYRTLIDMAAYNSAVPVLNEQPMLASSDNFGQTLAENNISIIGTFNINNIYYDFDKANIREDAALELDKLVLLMKGNQNIMIQMFSHTDSRGSNNYNNSLSKKRGQAAVNYMVEHGIDINRVSTEGRGESQLVNSCGNAIKCSEQAHQLNRRTAFILSA